MKYLITYKLKDPFETIEIAREFEDMDSLLEAITGSYIFRSKLMRGTVVYHDDSYSEIIPVDRIISIGITAPTKAIK